MVYMQHTVCCFFISVSFYEAFRMCSKDNLTFYESFNVDENILENTWKTLVWTQRAFGNENTILKCIRINVDVTTDSMDRCLILIHVWQWVWLIFNNKEVCPNIFAQIVYFFCHFKCLGYFGQSQVDSDWQNNFE